MFVKELIAFASEITPSSVIPNLLKYLILIFCKEIKNNYFPKLQSKVVSYGNYFNLFEK